MSTTDHVRATALARDAANTNVPARPCHYCGTETTHRARIGIPATESFSWEPVCFDDNDRAFRSRDEVEQTRAARRAT